MVVMAATVVREEVAAAAAAAGTADWRMSKTRACRQGIGARRRRLMAVTVAMELEADEEDRAAMVAAERT